MLGSLITQSTRFATRTLLQPVRTAQDVLELAEGVWGLIRGGHEPSPPPSTPGQPVDRQPEAVVTPVHADPVAHADEVMEGHIAHEVVEPAPPPPAADIGTSHLPAAQDELVEEVADAGAEDGAGAQVRVAEPWESYRLMTAADIADRLATATVAEVAAVELYELAGRRRKSVLSAAEQRLKAA